MSLGVLGKDGTTIGKDAKGGSITYDGQANGELIIKLGSRGREDS